MQSTDTKELVHGKKKNNRAISGLGICYKLDRRCKAFLNNTFSLGLDLGTVVIGGESSWKWRPIIKVLNTNEIHVLLI